MPGDHHIIEAALRCFATFGVGATSLDDVAVEARVGRSTVYRSFPGGKPALVDAATTHEVERYVIAFERRMDLADDLVSLLTEAVALGAEALSTWPALRAVLFHRAESLDTEHPYPEQELILRELDRLLAPHLRRYLDDEVARATTDIGSRLVLSYVLVPDGIRDLTEPAQARRFVLDVLLPVVDTHRAAVALRAPDPAGSAPRPG